MDNSTAVVSVLGGIIGIALHAIALTYIQKLERINCPCAAHPYRDFLKYFMIVSIVVIAINMFMPFYGLAKAPTAVGAFVGIFLVLWVIATVVFYALAIVYVRYLVREKCSCSEDVRREVLYIWSILELVFLGIILFLSVFNTLILAVVGAAASKLSPASLRNIRTEILRNNANPISTVTRGTKVLSKQLSRIGSKISGRK